MLYTPHFLAGAGISALIPYPSIYIPLGILSHILLDLTPHNDLDIEPGITLEGIFHLPKKQKTFFFSVIAVDIVLMGISALWIIFFLQKPYLVIGGIAGIAPDVIEQGLMLFGKSLPGWFNNLQWRVSKKYGFISYPIVSLIGLYLILYL